MFERILVPLDGSRFGSMAVSYAVEIAERFGAEVILMSAAVPTPVEPVGVGITVRTARLEDRRHFRRATRYLQRKALGVRKQGIACSHHVVMGQPVRSILQTCRRRGADLIVMATHGRGGLKRAVLGSVADQVARESRTPVLLVQRGRRSSGPSVWS